MALGRALTREGNHTEAREQLEWALELYGIDSMAVHRAHVLVLLASMHHGRRDLGAARGRCGAPRSWSSRPRGCSVQRPPATRRFGPVSHRAGACRHAVAGDRKSTPEISRELHVSVNTVRTQVRAIYHKLDASSRAEAVTRAHRLGLLPVKFT